MTGADLEKLLADAGGRGVEWSTVRWDVLDTLARRVIAAEKLAEALRELAMQNKTDEMQSEHDEEFADYEDGYDGMIDLARAAIAAWDAA